jgi:hypothetical protein
MENLSTTETQKSSVLQLGSFNTKKLKMDLNNARVGVDIITSLALLPRRMELKGSAPLGILINCAMIVLSSLKKWKKWR